MEILQLHQPADNLLNLFTLRLKFLLIGSQPVHFPAEFIIFASQHFQSFPVGKSEMPVAQVVNLNPVILFKEALTAMNEAFPGHGKFRGIQIINTVDTGQIMLNQKGLQPVSERMILPVYFRQEAVISELHRIIRDYPRYSLQLHMDIVMTGVHPRGNSLIVLLRYQHDMSHTAESSFYGAAPFTEGTLYLHEFGNINQSVCRNIQLYHHGFTKTDEINVNIGIRMFLETLQFTFYLLSFILLDVDIGFIIRQSVDNRINLVVSCFLQLFAATEIIVEILFGLNLL